MKKYRVIRTCSGFKGRRWYEGDIVEFNDNDSPPHHFELINDKKKGKKKDDDNLKGEKPISFSEVTKVIKKTPKSGFAKDFEGAKPQEMKTSSQALKNKTK